jgi:hypothetical protein
LSFSVFVDDDASRCLVGSLKGAVSAPGDTIWTPGSEVAQEICEMVLVVTLPAASDSLTVRSTGVLLVQATLTQVSVLVAVTAT